MSKKIKLILSFVLVAIFVAAIVWKYVNKASTDFYNKKPDVTFTFTQIMEKAEADTAFVTSLKSSVVSVSGTVKKISTDAQATSIELGENESMSSIICQMDQRHASDLAAIKEGSAIKIKGKVTGINIDTDLGLGNTLEMNFCSLDK